MALASGKSVYARVYQPTKWDNYLVNLAVDEETATRLAEEGMDVYDANGGLSDGKDYSEYGPYIVRFKEKEKPKVVGPDGRTEFDKLIGNGSDIVVQYRARDYDYRGKKGTAFYLKAVQVVNHVPYVAVDEDGNPKPAGEREVRLEFTPQVGKVEEKQEAEPDRPLPVKRAARKKVALGKKVATNEADFDDDLPF